MALLDDPKVRLVGYRTQLITSLLKHEYQRRELADAREQRNHEIELVKLKNQLAQLEAAQAKALEPVSPAVVAAKEFLARIEKGKETA